MTWRDVIDEQDQDVEEEGATAAEIESDRRTDARLRAEARRADEIANVRKAGAA